MKNKKWIFIAGAAVFVGLLVVLNLGTRRETSVRASVEKVAREDLVSIISASGEIKPKKMVNISAQIPGRVVKLGVREGQDVAKGEFLLSLDSSQYEANAERDRATISSSRVERIKAEATHGKNQSHFERQKNLFDNDLISKEQLEQARVQFEISEATLKSIDFQVAQAQASLKSTLDNLAKTVFSSPIDGIITSLRVEEGEVAMVGTMNNPGTVLMTIADLSVMEVEVEVDETDVVGVSLGQAADIRVDAFPGRVYRGQVTEIGSSAIQKSGVSTSSIRESKDFKVVVTLDDPSKDLKPGLSANADIVTAEKAGALTVPIASLVLREKTGDAPAPRKTGSTEEEGVFILEEGRARFVPIRKGIMGDLTIEVLEGLREGQEIVAGPYDVLRTLTDGTLIKPEPRKDEPAK